MRDRLSYISYTQATPATCSATFILNSGLRTQIQRVHVHWSIGAGHIDNRNNSIVWLFSFFMTTCGFMMETYDVNEFIPTGLWNKLLLGFDVRLIWVEWRRGMPSVSYAGHFSSSSIVTLRCVTMETDTPKQWTVRDVLLHSQISSSQQLCLHGYFQAYFGGT